MGERGVIRVKAAGFVFGVREGVDDPEWASVIVTPGTEGTLLACGSDGYSARWDRAFLLDAVGEGCCVSADDGSLRIGRDVDVSVRHDDDEFVRSAWFEFVGVEDAEADDEPAWEPKVGERVGFRCSGTEATVFKREDNGTFRVRYDDGRGGYCTWSKEELRPLEPEEPEVVDETSGGLRPGDPVIHIMSRGSARITECLPGGKYAIRFDDTGSTYRGYAASELRPVADPLPGIDVDALIDGVLDDDDNFDDLVDALVAHAARELRRRIGERAKAEVAR